MIAVVYHNHELRKQRVAAFARQVVEEYNNGVPAQTIANKYINPKTGKNYTRGHIYWILKKFNK